MKNKKQDSEYTKALKSLKLKKTKDGEVGDCLPMTTENYRNYVNAAAKLKRETNGGFNYMTRKSSNGYFLWRVK